MKTELRFTGPEIELLRSAFGAGRHRAELRGNFKTAPPVLNETLDQYTREFFSPAKGGETSWITEIGPVFGCSWLQVDFRSTPILNYMRENYGGVGGLHSVSFRVDVDVDGTREAALKCLKGLKVEDVVLEVALSRMLCLLDDMGDMWHRSWSPATHLISDYRSDPWSWPSYHDGYVDRFAAPHPLWEGTTTSLESKYKILSDLCQWWYWTSAREMYRVLLRDFGEILVGPIRYGMLRPYMGHLSSSRVVDDFLDPEMISSSESFENHDVLIHGNHNAYLFRLGVILMSYLAYDWFIARDVIAREGLAECRYFHEGEGDLFHSVVAGLGRQAMLTDFAADWWSEFGKSTGRSVITYGALARGLFLCVICGEGLTEDETFFDSLMCMFCDGERVRRNELRQQKFLMERSLDEIATEEFMRGFEP